MATKKQKREAALARREAFLVEEREIGRQALEKARREREEKALRDWTKGHEKHFKFVDECPHCAKIKKEQAEKARLAAIEKIALSTKNGRLKKKGMRVLDTPVDGVLPEPMVMMLEMESPQPIPFPEPVAIQGVDPLAQPFSNRAALRGAFSSKARA